MIIGHKRLDAHVRNLNRYIILSDSKHLDMCEIQGNVVKREQTLLPIVITPTRYLAKTSEVSIT